MPSKFKSDATLIVACHLNRTHEECSGCRFEYALPAPCPGHVSGPTPCGVKSKLEEKIAGYEDGIPYDHDGRYIFPKAQDLPKTHFPSQYAFEFQWHLVREGTNLPEVGQEIMFVKDVRGTQDEETRNSLSKMGIGEKHPDQKVMHGFVTDVGFSEELGDHWITAAAAFMPDGGPIGSISADHITYWKPMDQPPEDTFVRSPYHYHTIFQIVQKASVEISKGESCEE